MKKILLFLFFLGSCSNFDFVHENSNQFLLNKKTLISVSGDNTDQAKIFLNNLLGDIESNPNYLLSLNIKKNVSKLVLETSSVATKYTIIHSVNYSLLDVFQDCVVFVFNESTSINYDSKSEGYSFGSDRAKIDAEIENLRMNISNFFINLNIHNPQLKCLK